MHTSSRTFSKATGHLFSVLCLLFLSTSVVNAAVDGPSFSCDKASTYTERYMCEHGNAEDWSVDAGMFELDNKLARTYKKFLSKLPSSKRNIAKRIQSLWIKNRDYRCGYRVYNPLSITETNYNSPGNELAVLTARRNESVGLCIKEYYRNAITSLEHGVLLAHVIMMPKTASYPIGINGIKSLVIKNNTSKTTNCDGGRNDSADIFIDTGTKLIPFGEIKDFYCGMKEFDRHFPYELTIYLTQSGDLLTAKRQVDEYTEKSTAENMVSINGLVSLMFFRLENENIVWYEGNGNNSLMLQSASGPWGYHRKGGHAAGFNAIKGGIRFDYIVKNEPYVWSVFKKKTNVDVLTSTTKYSTATPSDFNNTILATEDFNDIFGKLYRDNTAATFSGSDSMCSPVIKGISNYMDLLHYVSDRDVSLAHAFFIAEHNLGKLDISDMKNIISETTGMLLFYLDKAREHSQWKDDLVDFSTRHFAPLGAHRAGQSSDIFVLRKKGYYSDTGCAVDESFRDLRFGTNTLENWIYLFWARRISDGTLDRTEKFLKMVKHIQ